MVEQPLPAYRSRPSARARATAWGAVGRAELVEDVTDVLFDGVQHHH